MSVRYAVEAAALEAVAKLAAERVDSIRMLPEALMRKELRQLAAGIRDGMHNAFERGQRAEVIAKVEEELCGEERDVALRTAVAECVVDELGRGADLEALVARARKYIAQVDEKAPEGEAVPS